MIFSGFITCGQRSWSWQGLHVTDSKREELCSYFHSSMIGLMIAIIICWYNKIVFSSTELFCCWSTVYCLMLFNLINPQQPYESGSKPFNLIPPHNPTYLDQTIYHETPTITYTQRAIYWVQIWVFGVQIYSKITRLQRYYNCLHICRQRVQL